MRVLRVAPLASATGKYGGPFDTARRQARLAIDAGLSVAFFAPHLAGDMPKVSSTMPFESPTVRPMLPRTAFLLLCSRGATKSLRVAIRSSDVVHLSLSRELFPVLSLILALAARRTVIVQPHGMLTSRTSLLHRAIDVFLRPLVRRCDAIVALTAVEESQIRGWIGDSGVEIRVIGNPTSGESKKYARSAGTARSREAIFVARLHPRKRVDVFIEAAKHAKRMGWDESYAVVGPDQGELQVVLQANEELDNFSYEGAIPGEQVVARISQSEVFVLPSLNEPWGNVLATSLAIGLPVVAAKSAALSATIEEHSAGEIFADGNSQELAEAVHRVVTMNDGEYDALSHRALTLAARELSDESVALRLLALYQGKGGV